MWHPVEAKLRLQLLELGVAHRGAGIAQTVDNRPCVGIRALNETVTIPTIQANRSLVLASQIQAKVFAIEATHGPVVPKPSRVLPVTLQITQETCEDRFLLTRDRRRA